ncbi:MAG: COQ9 family protein [Alphaproteobacteria bacterium]|nr:COQ9 family protein [Alphaproteobacteria bacterium]
MSQAETDMLDKMRAEILHATLPHIAFDGWTMSAAEAGAADAGYKPGDAVRAFPGGPVEMIVFFSRQADRDTMAEMEKRGAAELKVRERVTLGVRLRLEQNTQHREAIRRALAVLSFPQNAALGAQCLYRTVDAIWYAAGDTATDYNFYTKRGLLAGVYSATLLYWLNDNSEGFADTWSFLDRRIADVMAVPKTLGQIGKRFERMPNPLRVFAPGPRRRRRRKGSAAKP